MLELIESIPGYVIISIVFLFFLFGFDLLKNGVKITTDKFTIKTVDDAIIIEKIIEIAYEISYLQSTKKLKQQMKVFEEKMNSIFEDATKDYRKKLLKNLDLEERYIFNLNDTEDVEVFINALDVVKKTWKDYVREFYRESLSVETEDDKIDNLKKVYIDNLEKIRIETLNKYYREKIGDTTRKVSRNEVYQIFKANEEVINLRLLETFDNALLVENMIELEKNKKIKEIDLFFKGQKKK